MHVGMYSAPILCSALSFEARFRVRLIKLALVVGVWLVWVGLVWRFFLGSLVAGAGAVVSLVRGVLVAARHDHSG